MAPDDPAPDPDRVQDRAEERQHERAEAVEAMVERGEWRLEELDYPVSSEDLAVEYSDQPLDLPNETETMGDVFDRLVDEEFDSPSAVREAVYGALTGPAGAPTEYNDERDLEELTEVADEPSTADEP